MALYPYSCSKCGLEFNLERGVEQVQDPAVCPEDGAPARRVYGVVTAPRAGEDASEGGAQAGAPSPGAVFHDHGDGSEPHWH